MSERRNMRRNKEKTRKRKHSKKGNTKEKKVRPKKRLKKDKSGDILEMLKVHKTNLISLQLPQLKSVTFVQYHP